MTYEILPHTADVKGALWGRTLLELHQSATDMLREVLVGESLVEDRKTVVVPLEGCEPAEQFFRFVRQLVYLYDVESFVPCRVASLDPPTVTGETFDAERHVYEHHVKAVTRHQYAFEKGPDGYRAEMVFDL